MSPGWMPAVCAGPVLADAGDERAARLVEAEALGDLVGHALDADAEPAAPRLAVLLELARSTGLASAEGMAKPMPIEPPEGE